MTWSYRKRIKLIPGVHINLSRKGMSTSIGIPGMSVTLGHNGAYLNTGLPGTGIYHRQKITPASPSKSNEDSGKPESRDSDNIFSVEPAQVTSQDLQGIKDAILASQNQRKELRKDLRMVRMSLAVSNLTITLLYLFLIGFLVKSLTRRTIKERQDKRNAINEIRDQIDKSRVSLDVKFDETTEQLYQDIISTFQSLASSRKIWDVTGAYANDRVATRSAASTSIRTQPVEFGFRQLDEVRSSFNPLWMKNANGGDLFLYPGFLVFFSNRKSFGVISIEDLTLKHDSVRYIESGKIPADAKIIDYTWANVNKNGTPDRRFKDNHQIPIVRYGALLLSTDTGLHEEYMVSNYEASKSFADAFAAYQRAISTSTPIVVP